MKRLLKMAAVVVVLGLMAVMVGGAVTSAQDGEGPLGTFLGRVAEKLGVSENELKGAIEETQVEMIDEAVAEGRLTEEQAARLRERAEEGATLFPFGRGPGFGGPGAGVVPEAAAEALGIPQDQLMQELRDGKSLAEVAEGQGMSVDELSEALLAQVKAQLDALVADGKLTQEQADQIFQRTEENIDSIVNAEGGLGGCGGPRRGPGGFGGPPGGGGGFGGRWFGAPSDDGAAGSMAAPDGTT